MLSAILTHSASCQTNPIPLRQDTRFEGSALNADIDVLEHAYKTMHAGLYRYRTPAEIDLEFDLLRERFRDGATLSEAYVALAEFGASIRCGHTYPNFYNQPKAIVEALFKGTNRLPFEFLWLDGRMVVTRDLSRGQALRPGDEVKEINGVKAGEVLARLVKLARADGSNDAKRRALLQVQGANRYEPFDIYYALCFPLQGTNFHLKTLGALSKVPQELDVQPLSFEGRIAALKGEAGGAEAPWKLTYLNPRTALLRMPTWALYNTKRNWTNFLDHTFDELATKPGVNLIVDLRDNEGGLTSVGDAIMARLVTKPTQAGEMKRFVRSRSAPKSLVPNLDTWDWSFLDWGTNATSPVFQPQGGAVFYRMRRFDDNDQGDVIIPKGPRFKGKVVVLMNSENSSATFQFEQLAQANKIATLVGEPSGGNRRGINGGAFFFVSLPNTKIEMDLPLVATLPDSPQPDAGIMPDVRVKVTPEGLAAGKDEYLIAALKMLR